jgi:hypothetical protein
MAETFTLELCRSNSIGGFGEPTVIETWQFPTQEALDAALAVETERPNGYFVRRAEDMFGDPC